MIEQNFIKIYEESFKSHWELSALTNYKGKETLSYKELAEQIARIHILFNELGIEKGDKIALIGKNHTSWSVVLVNRPPHNFSVINRFPFSSAHGL